MGGLEMALCWQGMCCHELMWRNTVPSSSSMPSVCREALCSSIRGCQILCRQEREEFIDNQQVTEGW